MKTGLYLGGTPIGRIIAASTGGSGISLQSKNINPTKQIQTITPDAAYDGLSQVIVNPIPGNYITTETTSAPKPDQMEAGTTAYANGEAITGTLPLISEDITQQGDDIKVSGSNLIISLINGIKRIFGIGSSINLQVPLSDMGNATAADVVAGKTFTSTAGLKQTGSMVNNGAISEILTSNTSYIIPEGYHNGLGTVTANVSATTNYDLSDLTVSSSDVLNTAYFINSNGTKDYGSIIERSNSDISASGRTVSIPAGYYASNTSKSINTGTLSSPSISINSSGVITATSGISSSGYLSTSASQSNTKSLTTQGSKTWTPTTNNQTIKSGTYITGTQTIKGDSNLISSNIKNGVSIFGVNGNYTGEGTSSFNLFTKEITVSSARSLAITGLPSGSGITNDTIRIIVAIGSCTSPSTANICSWYYDRDQSLNTINFYRQNQIYKTNDDNAGIEFNKLNGETTLTIATNAFYFNGTYTFYIIYE